MECVAGWARSNLHPSHPRHTRTPAHTPHHRIIRFAELVLAAYPVQLALGLFAGVAGLMVAGFLAYQVG
jgi:hypothetical protein